MARLYTEAGFDWVVDLEKFFDRVNHEFSWPGWPAVFRTSGSRRG